MAKQSRLFWVVGRLPFPVDMLRYDAAVPASERDANLIASTFEPRGRHAVVVCVRAEPPITPDRWLSFGWRVMSESEARAWNAEGKQS